MPISSAAMSMSRIAIHARPMRPCTRFEAIQVSTIDEGQHDEVARLRASRSAPMIGTPNSVRSGASIAPETL